MSSKAHFSMMVLGQLLLMCWGSPMASVAELEADLKQLSTVFEKDRRGPWLVGENAGGNAMYMFSCNRQLAASDQAYGAIWLYPSADNDWSGLGEQQGKTCKEMEADMEFLKKFYRKVQWKTTIKRVSTSTDGRTDEVADTWRYLIPKRCKPTKATKWTEYHVSGMRFGTTEREEVQCSGQAADYGLTIGDTNPLELKASDFAVYEIGPHVGTGVFLELSWDDFSAEKRKTCPILMEKQGRSFFGEWTQEHLVFTDISAKELIEVTLDTIPEEKIEVIKLDPILPVSRMAAQKKRTITIVVPGGNIPGVPGGEKDVTMSTEQIPGGWAKCVTLWTEWAHQVMKYNNAHRLEDGLVIKEMKIKETILMRLQEEAKDRLKQWGASYTSEFECEVPTTPKWTTYYHKGASWEAGDSFKEAFMALVATKQPPPPQTEKLKAQYLSA